MKVLLRITLSLIAISMLVILIFALRDNGPQAQTQFVAFPQDIEGFTRATGPRPIQFPDDHGPHPEFQTEWWYYTGNLKSDDGRQFGYQLTFFRRALLPPDQQFQRASSWAANQVYMAHFALTDVEARRFQAFERFARGAAGLAGAQASPYRVWLQDWRVEEVSENTYHLRASQEGVEINLILEDMKGPVLQGDQGYSRKGSDPGNASYYISQTRLASSGKIQINQAVYNVSGLSWMDHEFSTSALAPDQVGWDWFALQLDDGTDLMVYQIRKEIDTNGVEYQVDPYSSGTLVLPDGSANHLEYADFEIAVLDTWISPHSGAVYPARWTVSVPSADLVLEIEPTIADQELSVSFVYWEGAVKITGTHAGRPVSGSGYVELTGYASSLAGQF